MTAGQPEPLPVSHIHPRPASINLEQRIEGFLRTQDLNEVFRAHMNHRYADYLETIGIGDTRFVDHTAHHLIDEHGARYLDMVGGYATTHWGRRPKVTDAVRQALDLSIPSLVQFGMPVLSAMLAAELARYAGPPFERVFFTNSGAETIDQCLKMGRVATGRRRAIAFEAGYHGLTLGALTVNGSKKHRKLFGVEKDSIVLPFNDIEQLQRTFARHHRRIASVVIEPIVARTGEVATDHFLLEARRLCDQYGSVLVFDEVKTGFGRTGRPFFYQWSGVTPDALAVAKGLSGGVTATGAVLYQDGLYRRVFNHIDKIAVFSSTFKENNIAMAVGLQVLDLFASQPEIYDHVLELESRLRVRLAAHQHDSYRFRVRGRGMLLTIDLQPHGRTNLLRALVDRVEGDLFYGMVARRLFVDEQVLVALPNRFGASLAVIPALDLPLEEIDRFADSLIRAVDAQVATDNLTYVKDIIEEARTVL